jgi:hypothetical protein
MNAVRSVAETSRSDPFANPTNCRIARRHAASTQQSRRHHLPTITLSFRAIARVLIRTLSVPQCTAFPMAARNRDN